MKPFVAIFLMTASAVSSGAASLQPAAGAFVAIDQMTTVEGASWRQCAPMTNDREARLQCFDRWAAQQLTADPAALAPDAALIDATTVVAPPPSTPLSPVEITILTPPEHDCLSPEFSETSRFWELEAGTDCGTFGIRAFRPISLSWIGSDSVNTQPSSAAPGHTAAAALNYRPSETRIQLSVRTKIAQGLFTGKEPLRRDSLWFGYSQQSYWQLFNGALSRPFRTTDHEPEITYIYPTEAQLPAGWRLRYTGISLVHQSNGQSLPLSRSWNRAVLMAGAERGDRFRLQARIWKRMREDSANDDNPGISNLIGRAELSAFWSINQDHALGATLRHSLRADANGSLRLEWLRKLGDSRVPGSRSGLRLHTQLFSGYGDSLVDFNRRRTVLSVGLSLVDW